MAGRFMFMQIDAAMRLFSRWMATAEKQKKTSSSLGDSILAERK